MVEFKIHDHDIRPGVKLVEVLVDGKTACTITPDDSGRGIRLISTHIETMGRIDGGMLPGIPAIGITFKV